MIKGEAATRKVFINGAELKPDTSQKVMNHSPDGFAWGYQGSGPAQLALALMLYFTGQARGYQELKRRLIASFSMGMDFEVDSEVVKRMCDEIKKEVG